MYIHMYTRQGLVLPSGLKIMKLKINIQLE